MGTLYETIRSLCDKKGIKPGKMCSDLGMSKSIMTKLQDDPTRTIKLDTARKIADYFSVTLEELDSGDLSESDAEKAPAFNDESKRPYVDMDTARIWSPHPVAILAAQYKVPTATLQQIIGCDFNMAGNIALGLEAPTDEQLRRVAAAFCVPYGDLMRGWVPLYANRDLSFDNIHRRSDRSHSPEYR